MPDALQAAFTERFGEGGIPVEAAAPGRVNLLGEHTDYHEGFVLPTVVNLKTTVLTRGRSDGRFRLQSMSFPTGFEGPLPDDPKNVEPVWARYVLGVAQILKGVGVPVTGCDLLVHSDIPMGTGLSSSAALEVAASRAILLLVGQSLDAVQLARLCQTAERQWAGVACGVLDQMAVSVGAADHALFLDCRSLNFELVPLPSSALSILVCDSGTSRHLASTGYQQRRAEGVALLAQLSRYDTTLRSLRDVTPSLWTQSLGSMPEILRRRGQHVLDENQRVLDGVAHLKASRYREFGALLFTSHDSLSRLYEVSTSALDEAVRTLQSCPGVLGAKLTGAGFGGSVIALVEPARAHSIVSRLRQVLPSFSIRVMS